MERDELDQPDTLAAGVKAIVENESRSVLEKHIAAATRNALEGLLAERLDAEQIRKLALQAAERQLAELGDPPLYYETAQEWIEQWLLPVYRRSVLGHERTWCPQWWHHPEAVARLESLWRAWEHLRLDAGTGLSMWFRDHADHHMTVLLDANGPFKGCDSRHSDRPVEELPYEPPPEGMFDTAEDLAGNGRAAAAPAAAKPPAGMGRQPTLRRGR